MNRVIFWDHYDAGMGGIEKMIITLTKEFSYIVDVVLISKKTGIIYQSLNDYRDKFIHYDPYACDFEKEIFHDDLLIDFGMFPDLLKLTTSNPYLLIWRVFPSLQLPNVLATFLFKKIFQQLDKKSSLVFMDHIYHETTCKELNLSLRKCILPLPITSQKKSYDVEKKRSVINITYIGRGNKIWKIKPVKKLVEDLTRIDGRNFVVHIFTDTDEFFQKELKEFSGMNVKIKYYFKYTMERLSKKLVEVSDLHYSMGAAALEGAVFGIPTIIADCSYTDFPANYRYRWFVEEEENRLGRFLNCELPSGYILEEMIDVFQNRNKLQNLSDTTFKKTMKNYSSSKVVQTIQHLKPKTRIQDVIRFMPSYWLSGLPIKLLKI